MINLRLIFISIIFLFIQFPALSNEPDLSKDAISFSELTSLKAKEGIKIEQIIPMNVLITNFHQDKNDYVMFLVLFDDNQTSECHMRMPTLRTSPPISECSPMRK